METIRFPSVVGNDVLRATDIIRTRLGPNTSVTFVVVSHSGPLTQPLPFQRLVPNQVTLHLDTKWNAIARTPVFYGTLHTLAEWEDDATSASET